ncbi:MAG: DUF3467 domain-containing protein [Planctomycetaceae bacterium]|nr:DUF3467 domain-containing protein [Planctomycetales bacterium]MCB9923744.1 DUF3467 domain-containing protein [Planctomycetaceae bacterium]
MSQQNQPNSDGNSQQVQIQHVTARVPESVSRGAFSTGVIVMTGGSEFILDFIQNIGGPPQVAARVVMPHAALPQFADALKKNLGMYTERFGPPPELPKPQQPAKPQSAQELYDELKLPDSLLSGAYSNGVMIGHTASEFKLDFLTNLFPHSAVSSRVYLSAPQVPRLLESLTSTYQQFQERVRQQQAQQQQQQRQTPPPSPPNSSEDEMG